MEYTQTESPQVSYKWLHIIFGGGDAIKCCHLITSHLSSKTLYMQISGTHSSMTHALKNRSKAGWFLKCQVTLPPGFCYFWPLFFWNRLVPGLIFSIFGQVALINIQCVLDLHKYALYIIPHFSTIEMNGKMIDERMIEFISSMNW